MMMNPLLIKELNALKAGEEYSYSGKIHTLRDCAIRRMSDSGFVSQLSGTPVYFCGPSGPQPGGLIGACGPTTSSRFDRYREILSENGVLVTIGKGPRGKEVAKDCREGRHFYLALYGGLGALFGSRVVSYRVIAFPELGPEAIFELTVRDFPLILAYDKEGGSIF